MRDSLGFFEQEQLGTVIHEFIKCGKPNCHCVNGKGHSAFYHYFYEKGNSGNAKLRKKYLPKYEAKKLKQLIQYRRNKLNAYTFIHRFSGEFILMFNEDFNNFSHVHKRLHIMLKKAGLNSFSKRRINDLMHDIPKRYENSLLQNISVN